MITHPHVEGQKDEIPINDYYKRFLGNKIDKMTDRSIGFHTNLATDRTMPQYEKMIANHQKNNEVIPFVINNETFPSNVEIEKNMRDLGMV